MNINPWTVYWILQLDSINGALLAVTIASLISLITFSVVWIVNNEEAGYSWNAAKLDTINQNISQARKCIKWSAIAFFTSIVLSAFTPSTKTAAVIIIIPAIANNPNVQREASELYDLAKKALKDVVDTKQPDDRYNSEEKPE